MSGLIEGPPSLRPQGPDTVPLDELPLEPMPVAFTCLNGPCAGSTVNAPGDATPGTACALPWKTSGGVTRYAVYILVDYNGQRGLMFMTNHQKPEKAQEHVQRLTFICAEAMS